MQDVTDRVIQLLQKKKRLEEWYKFFNVSRYHFVRITSGKDLNDSEKDLYKEIVLQAIQCGIDYQGEIASRVEELKRCYLDS